MPAEKSETVERLAKMESDTEFRRRIENDHASIRNRQHELAGQIQAMVGQMQAMQMDQVNRNSEITVALHDLKSSMASMKEEKQENTLLLKKLNEAVCGDGDKRQGILEILRGHAQVVDRASAITWVSVCTIITAGFYEVVHFVSGRK